MSSGNSVRPFQSIMFAPVELACIYGHCMAIILQMKHEAQWSVAEYKNRFTQLLRQVENGGRHVITRHGRPIARVAPATPGRSITNTLASVRNNRVPGRRDLKALIRKGRR